MINKQNAEFSEKCAYEIVSLKSIDMIVISIMDKTTGEYRNKIITNRPRWKNDTKDISRDSLVRIEIFKLGVIDPFLVFYSLEEFENAINL